MAPKADPFVQRRLLDVARIDQAISAAEHRRRTLPELPLISAGTSRVEELRNAGILAQTEIGDLDRAARKLDKRSTPCGRGPSATRTGLAAGIAPSKDLENMQHEIVSLARRQSTLEDEALELMERRRGRGRRACAAPSGDLATAARADLEAAQRRRDDAFADLDDGLQRVSAERATLVDGMPPT